MCFLKIYLLKQFFFWKSVIIRSRNAFNNNCSFVKSITQNEPKVTVFPTFYDPLNCCWYFQLSRNIFEGTSKWQLWSWKHDLTKQEAFEQLVLVYFCSRKPKPRFALSCLNSLLINEVFELTDSTTASEFFWWKFIYVDVQGVPDILSLLLFWSSVYNFTIFFKMR